MAAQEYVTNAGWLRQVARIDTVDVVADEFERPVPDGASAFWNPGRIAWPRSARGRRTSGRMHPHPALEMGADLAG